MEPDNPEPEHKCCNCRFRVNIAQNLDLFECRRHSPLVTGGMMSSVDTVWPNVKPHDWCGDFEHRYCCGGRGDLTTTV